MSYTFTNEWFALTALPTWEDLILQINPQRILEIGSYEGASTTFLMDKLCLKHSVEVHCVDTWAGGVEHAGSNMSQVEARFDANIAHAKSLYPGQITVHKHKGFSDVVLSALVSQGFQNQFDFIYVDGSHQAPDVFCDAVLSFRLLRVGGVIAFDDYLWSEELPNGIDPLRCPKPAIDAFTNIYCRKLKIIPARLYQLYVQKIAD